MHQTITKQRFIDLYLDIAARVAKMSHARRAQVGAVIVADDAIISYGYNGMPHQWPNDCEIHGQTRPEVLHAESNALMKLAKNGYRAAGATMFCTHSPCLECAKLIVQAGITAVYYTETYRVMHGLDFLQKSGIKCHENRNTNLQKSESSDQSTGP